MVYMTWPCTLDHASLWGSSATESGVWDWAGVLGCTDTLDCTSGPTLCPDRMPDLAHRQTLHIWPAWLARLITTALVNFVRDALCFTFPFKLFVAPPFHFQQIKTIQACSHCTVL